MGKPQRILVFPRRLLTNPKTRCPETIASSRPPEDLEEMIL